ncbi:MAG: DUF6107 family protein [Pseudomonadota bacterium]
MPASSDGPTVVSATQLLADPDRALWIAKFVGALAGSFISVAYVLPRGRREAFLRFGVGIVTGLIFGSMAGAKIADWLGLLGKVPLIEITLIGAASASLCAWWALGVLERIADHLPFRRGFMPPKDNVKDKEKEL